MGLVVAARIWRGLYWLDHKASPSRGDSAQANPTAAANPSPVDYTATEAEQKEIWQTEATFYGRVLDLDGNPVAGARVVLSRPQIPYLPAPGQKNSLYVTTDPRGNFSVVRYQAPSLTVGVEADGYSRTESAYGEFRFAPPLKRILMNPPPNARFPVIHKPDPSNPVIFRLRKMGPTVPLYSNSQIVWFGKPGTVQMEYPSTIQKPLGHVLLVEGSVDKASERPGKVSNQPYFDWWIEFTVPDGGLVKQTDQASVTAPADGYSEKVRIEYRAVDAPGSWTARPNLHYFARFSDGTHAKLTMNPKPDTDGRCLIQVESLYDPAGGRYFEYDKSKRLNLKSQ